MLRRILFSALSLICVFICLIAMACPTQTKVNFEPNGQVIGRYLPRDIFSTSGAEVSDNGDVTIVGPDANIYLNEINLTIRTVVIDLKEPAAQTFNAVMYYDTGNGLNELETAYATAFKGDEKIVFNIPETLFCKAARVDIDVDYKLNSVDLYDQESTAILSKLQNPWWEYVVCALVSVAVFVVIFLLDFKFNFCSKICLCFKNRKKTILIGSIALLGSLGISAAIELLCVIIFGPSSAGDNFNTYRFVLILGIVVSMVAIAFFVRSIDKKPEKLFLVLMLIVGTVMIFASPFGHIAWDVETHYKWALDASYIGKAYKTEADRFITSNQDVYWSKENAVDNNKNIQLVNSSDEYIVEEFEMSKRITHLPSGIFIALARFLGLNFYWRLTLGRLPNLLIYAFALYFGMKKLKSGKMILAVLAFLPTNMFVATNYSYDYWVNALSMLGVAYFVSEMQQPEKQISLKNNIIMCGSIALACVPKQIYAPLLLIPFLLRKNNFQKKKRYYIICAAAFVLLFLMLAARGITSVNSGGDLRGGAQVNSLQQFKFILGNPFTYAKTLLNFLWSYLSIGGAKDYICNMAYIGYGFGHGMMLSLMIFTAFTDKNKYDLNNKYFLLKGFNIVLLLGVAALVATALYISFTPVGSNDILGCQGRYLAPLLYPILSIIGSGFINNTINRKWYNGLILGCCTGVNFITIILTMTSRIL